MGAKKKKRSRYKAPKTRILHAMDAISIEDIALLLGGIILFAIIVTVGHYWISPTDDYPLEALKQIDPTMYFDLFIRQTAFKYLFVLLVPVLLMLARKRVRHKTWGWKPALVWAGTGLCLVALTFMFAPRVDGVENIPSAAEPKVTLFVMSFCPFGQQAEAQIAQARAQLGVDVDIKTHFIINDLSGRPEIKQSQCIRDNTLCSLHGITELQEDMRQQCILRDNPEAWWEYMPCINSECTKDSVEECWQGCAVGAGLDVDEIEACQEKDGIALALADQALSDRLQAYSSPSLFVNGEKYTGSDRSAEGYLAAICAGYKHPPKTCPDQSWFGATSRFKVESTIITTTTDQDKCTEEGVCPITEKKSPVIP